MLDVESGKGPVSLPTRQAHTHGEALGELVGQRQCVGVDVARLLDELPVVRVDNSGCEAGRPEAPVAAVGEIDGLVVRELDAQVPPGHLERHRKRGEIEIGGVEGHLGVAVALPALGVDGDETPVEVRPPHSHPDHCDLRFDEQGESGRVEGGSGGVVREGGERTTHAGAARAGTHDRE